MDITERLLDRADKTADDISHIREQTTAIAARLDKLNGSVGRHETQINELKVWVATKDEGCKAHSAHMAALNAKLDALASKSAIDSTTVFRIVLVVCLTAITIFGAKASGVIDALLTLLK